MKESLLDALIDTLKLSPYLLVTFLILELIEHKFSKNKTNIFVKNQKYGPIIGGILGGFPECGFSAMAANLFTGKIITIGTVIAIFLATSDEMIPIMISNNIKIIEIVKIVGIKILIGITVGIIVDIFYKNKKQNDIKNICQNEHCHCEKHNIFVSSLIHALKTLLFVLIANIIINLLIETLGVNSIENLLKGNKLIGYLGSSLIGLIPNCAASIMITEFYLSNLISIGTLFSGLLTGSGIGILLLFKNNKSIKENLFVLITIYVVGVLSGIIIDLII